MKRSFKPLALLLALMLILCVLGGCSFFDTEDPAPEHEEEESKDGGTVYTVKDSFFTLLSYMKVEGEADGTYALRVAVRVDISVFEYMLTVKAKDGSGGTVLDEQISRKEKIDRSGTVSFYFELSEDDIDSIAELSVSGSAKSYTNPSTMSSEARPRVKFKVGGEVWSECAVAKGEAIAMPDVPSLENEIFAGWYADTEYEQLFDLSSGVSGTTTLYARMIPDVASLTNKITTELASSMVTIHATYSKANPFASPASSTSSGIVIKTGTQTLILTCCHSVQLPSGYSYASFQVEDYLGNLYSASVYSLDGTKAIAPEYDLACLVVSGMENVSAMPLAEENGEVGDTVIALGSPGGQQNAISYGAIRKYTLVNIDIDESMSNVTFPAAHHTAPIKGGSSGGALLNCELELIGVNYAGLDDEFGDGYAVPIEKVREFLEQYVD